MRSCLSCNKSTSNLKFCSRSCAAKNNNIGKRRHGKPRSLCKVCGKKTKSSKRKYCSFECSGKSQMKNISTEERKAINAAKQSKYRQKRYRDIHHTANPEKIKEFYLNRPEGYEVDHIIPLSKGGLHHQDNLQYLLKEENRRKSNKLVESDGTAPPSDRYERPASL